ncbi:MAG: hypothetical protein JNN15_13765 [Blastocatellia bacterium]|nr:hypothetical protein [Blastocatellia bacterium]
MRNLKAQLFVSFLFFLFLACKPETDQKENLTEFEGQEKPQISSLLESGALKLGRIAPVFETIDKVVPFGEIVLIGLKNETDRDINFRIDCGTILRANDQKHQDLIVSRSLEGRVAAKSIWTGEAEVFALQMKKQYPYKSEYTLGRIATTGDLRKFVECFCFYRPSTPSGQSFDLTPVQYAIWKITENVSLSQILQYMKERTNSTEQELKQAEEKVKEQAEYTQHLLDECHISVKFLD